MSEYFLTDEAFYKAAGEYQANFIKMAQIKLFDVYEAEDAVSEALIKACSKRKQLRDENKLYYWLLRIIINHCNDILRAKLKEYSEKDINTLPLEDSRIIPHHERYEQALAIEKVLDVMLTLEPEEYSEVAILYYYRKFNYDKIAKELAIPIGTVKSRLSRAKKALKDSIIEANISFEDLRKVEDLSKWPDIKILR